jgi:hypothetical protein
VFYGSVARGQPVAGFFRLVMERSDSAAVGDAAALVNDVNSFGPRGISIIGSVAHIIDSEGQGEFESLGEIICNHHALLERFRLGVADVVLYVGLHLPLIGGMRFAHVNGQKVRALFVILIDLNDVAYLAAERWSSKASKYQYQRPVMGSFTDVKTAEAIESDDTRIGRVAAYL